MRVGVQMVSYAVVGSLLRGRMMVVVMMVLNLPRPSDSMSPIAARPYVLETFIAFVRKSVVVELEVDIVLRSGDVLEVPGWAVRAVRTIVAKVLGGGCARTLAHGGVHRKLGLTATASWRRLPGVDADPGAACPHTTLALRASEGTRTLLLAVAIWQLRVHRHRAGEAVRCIPWRVRGRPVRSREKIVQSLSHER